MSACRYRQLVAVRKRCGRARLHHRRQLLDARFSLALALRLIGEPEQAAEILTSVRDTVMRYPKLADMIKPVEKEMALTASACARKKSEQ